MISSERGWRQARFAGALVVGDAVGIFLCFATAYWLRYHAPGIGEIGAGPGLLAYAQAVLLVTGTWVAIFAYFGLYEPVRLIVQDRECSVDVIKVPDGCPVLIGRLPLELLDLNADEENARLIGNPDHDGHPMVDVS